LLLLDEPTANVDAALETELYDLLHQLNERLTIVLVTHDLGFVSHYVKNVACVNRRLIVHPTCDITGEMINAVYGSHVHMIRHDASMTAGDSHD
jgi:zinc transport system ATP-binding protein